jgi:hypothetical protein
MNWLLNKYYTLLYVIPMRLESKLLHYLIRRQKKNLSNLLRLEWCLNELIEPYKPSDDLRRSAKLFYECLYKK